MSSYISQFSVRFPRDHADTKVISATTGLNMHGYIHHGGIALSGKIEEKTNLELILNILGVDFFKHKEPLNISKSKDPQPGLHLKD